MEKVVSALEEIKSINNAYGISIDGICKLQAEISEAKVCMPIIGRFSSGKSALVNTILGYSKKIFREDITPETAVPAEIVYTDTEELAAVIGNDGTCRTMSIEDYRGYEADASTVKHTRIQLRNHFLEKIPDVMLVDMPGFESGYEVHNKAIDHYLPQSLAYLVAFPADDMIVRSSVGNILKELCLHEMPLCVVITKYDKKNDEFDITFAKMKESLKRFVGDREIRYCWTSSFTGDAEEVEVFLAEIQEKSQDILAGKYRKLLMPILENTQNYLKTELNGSQLSESELDEKEERLHKQLASLGSKFSKEQEDFNLEIAECVQEIKSDVQSAMEAEESSLVAMAMNHQGINEHLNAVVRKAVTISVKKRFLPKVEKYLRRVDKAINGESLGDVHISCSFDVEKLNQDIVGNAVAVAAAALVGGPIVGIIAGIVTGMVALLSGNRKREEAREKIRQKLRGEVFPQVLREVGINMEMEITKQIKLVNATMEEELTTQKNTLEKAVSDIRQQMNEEETKKENLAIDIKADLERVEEIKNGLR